MELDKSSTAKVKSNEQPLSNFSEQKGFGVYRVKERWVEFHLFAPEAKKVSVAGTFNRWSTTAHELRKDYHGHWKVKIRLEPGRYEYRFFVDGRWVVDPDVRNVLRNTFGMTSTLLEVR